jgi:hypothetical protein
VFHRLKATSREACKMTYLISANPDRLHSTCHLLWLFLLLGPDLKLSYNHAEAKPSELTFSFMQS